MISYSLARRNFMWGVGAATGLHALLRGAEAAAQGAKPPKRFMVIHHPVGGNHDNWKVTGTEYDFTLSMILDPFKDVRANMVVISGMNIIKKAKPGTAGSGCHEGNTVCLMTGEPHDGLWPGNGGDDAKVGAASVDQLFLNKAPTTLGAAAGKIASLQVACDERTDAREYSTRRLSASGPGVPMDPYLSPAKLYDRVFGNFMPNTSTGTMADLTKARAAKKSVLDFALKDMARLKTSLVPARGRGSRHTRRSFATWKRGSTWPPTAAIWSTVAPPAPSRPIRLGSIASWTTGCTTGKGRGKAIRTSTRLSLSCTLPSSARRWPAT